MSRHKMACQTNTDGRGFRRALELAELDKIAPAHQTLSHSQWRFRVGRYFDLVRAPSSRAGRQFDHQGARFKEAPWRGRCECAQAKQTVAIKRLDRGNRLLSLAFARFRSISVNKRILFGSFKEPARRAGCRRGGYEIRTPNSPALPFTCAEKRSANDCARALKQTNGPRPHSDLKLVGITWRRSAGCACM